MQIEILSRLVLCFLLQTVYVNAGVALTRHTNTHIQKHRRLMKPVDS